MCELKLDRSLVTDIERDEGARTVVKAIAAMARELKLELCVEGVETIQTARLLQSFGCEKAQGYHFGQPMSAEEFTALLTSRSQGAQDTELENARANRGGTFQVQYLERNKFAEG